MRVGPDPDARSGERRVGKDPKEGEHEGEEEQECREGTEPLGSELVGLRGHGRDSFLVLSTAIGRSLDD